MASKSKKSKSKKSSSKSGSAGKSSRQDVTLGDQQVTRGSGGETHQTAGDGGEVMTTGRSFKEGVYFKKGETLLRIDAREAELGPVVRVGAGGCPARVPPRCRLQVVSRAVQGGLTRGGCRRRTAAVVGWRGSGCPRRRRGAVGVPPPSAGAPQRRLGFCMHQIPPTGRAPPVGCDRNGEGARSCCRALSVG